MNPDARRTPLPHTLHPALVFAARERAGSRVPSVLLVSAIGVGLGLVLVMAARQFPTPASDVQGAVAAYPPPMFTATPSTTPSPDANGYFPPPTGGATRISRLSESPYADLLVPLQDALLVSDSAMPTSMITERFGLTLFDIRHLDGEGGHALRLEEGQALLEAALDPEDPPLLQGYFATDDPDVPCLELLLWPMGDDLPHPRHGTPMPYGPQSEALLRGDAATWRACRAQDGAWLWSRWGHGGYHEIVGAFWAQPQGGDGVYTVLRP